jgi:hypothetical protein
MPANLALADDLHRVLVRLTEEVLLRCPRLGERGVAAMIEAHATSAPAWGIQS